MVSPLSFMSSKNCTLSGRLSGGCWQMCSEVAAGIDPSVIVRTSLLDSLIIARGSVNAASAIPPRVLSGV